MFNPFRTDITDQAVFEWLSQFEEHERPLISILLKHFRYYGSSRVAEMVKNLYRMILAGSSSQIGEAWFVPVGYVTKSGSIIAYYFRVQNSIAQDRFASSADLSTLPLSRTSTVVFIDDFLGTGHQAAQVWKTVAKPAHLHAGCKFVYATLVAYREGLEYVRKQTGFAPLAVDVIEPRDRPFSPDSTVFSDDSERQSAEQIVEKYGKRLYPNHPLGYQRTQGLVGFFYSTPNNTLPIFWSTQNGWRPLLSRGDSYRDPAFLIGPPPGLNVASAGVSAITPLHLSNQLDEVNIEWESLVRLASEFKDAKVVLVLASMVKKLGIAKGVLEGILDLIRSLRELRHEKEHVRSALHVVSDSVSRDNLGIRILEAAAGTTIQAQSNVLALANMTDGLDGSVVVLTNGTILGNYIYPEVDSYDDPILPSPYARAAHASKVSEGLLLIFLTENRCAIFHAGHRVLWYRGAGWHLQSIDVDRGIRELSRRHDIDFPVLERVIRLAFLLSDVGKGALIVVGDDTRVLANSDPPKSTHIKWNPMEILTTPIEGLVGVVSQDGATIISGGGQVIQPMTTLRPPAGVVVEEETGRGTKHSTAAKISKITNAVCVAVSVDGRITVYSDGNVAFKVMG